MKQEIEKSSDGCELLVITCNPPPSPRCIMIIFSLSYLNDSATSGHTVTVGTTEIVEFGV